MRGTFLKNGVLDPEADTVGLKGFINKRGRVDGRGR